MRPIIIAGNWKMNGTRAESEALINALRPLLDPADNVQIVVCPPFTALARVGRLIQGTEIALGGQDVFWKDKGAYTGFVSPAMLLEVGCSYVIVGHSERRGRFGVPEPEFDAEILKQFGDNDRTVNLKLNVAITNNLRPICCVGETLAERQAGSTDDIVQAQTVAALDGITPDQITRVVFAYEPVWAIGTGETCAPDEADRVCGVIRSTVAKLYSPDHAEQVVIQYGGSVKPDNAKELLAKPNIDGALVGGASLKAADFAAIVAAA
jgi:triosephosphate isomerase (TIM)